MGLTSLEGERYKVIIYLFVTHILIVSPSIRTVIPVNVFLCFPFTRLSPKLRKYSRILPLNESENQAEEINEKTNDFTLPSSEQFTEKTLKPSHFTHTNIQCKDRKNPLVPRLQNLNEDEHSKSDVCVAGFILSPRAERPYKCNLCVKQFKYFSNLKSHMKIVHKKMVESSPEDSNSSTLGNGQVFQCEICYRNFKYFSNLRTHRLVHTSNDSKSND